MRPAVFVLLFCFLCLRTAAQTDSISQFLERADSAVLERPLEKIYLHLDRPSYLVGDTVWFKAYLLNGADLSAGSKSGILYLELVNDSGKVVITRQVEVMTGTGVGSFVLTTRQVRPGSYTLRGYTNLLRNFGEAAFFSRRIEVGTSRAGSILVSSSSIRHGADSVRATVSFRDMSGRPLGRHDFRIRLSDGRRNYGRQEITTDTYGNMEVDFRIPETVDGHKLTLVAEPRDQPELIVPLEYADPGSIELQFMPEGGHLVAGQPVRVAFKAVNANGLGADVSGQIVNKTGRRVADFESSHKGMGSFDLYPQPGESYFALIASSGKKIALPQVMGEGSGIRIINDPAKDSLDAVLTFSPGLNGQSFYLTGDQAGKVYYAGIVRGSSRIRISKGVFPTGVARFTVFNGSFGPLNERLVFIDHGDTLRINVTADRLDYQQRDSVSLALTVTDSEGNPVRGSFSIAITDESQVRSSDHDAHSIVAEMYFRSNVRGEVEDPGHYLHKSGRVAEDIDHLLLTQGWTAHDWSGLDKREYAAEAEFTVAGRVVNAFGKGLATGVNLLSTRPFMLKNTESSMDGDFAFNEFPPLDTAVFHLQARDKKGREFNVGLEVDEFKSPEFTRPAHSQRPWYVNSDTTLIHQARQQILAKQEELKAGPGSKLLEEVTVTARRVVPGSRNLNGAGVSDFVIDEQTLKEEGKKTLKDLIIEKVPKLMVLRLKEPLDGNRYHYYYTINGAKLKFVIDGIYLDEFFRPEICGSWCPDTYKHFQDSYLEYIRAEDVKGIEVMNYGSNSYRYTAQYPQPNTKPAVASGFRNEIKIDVPMQVAVSWIEVTTRSGEGPIALKTIPGTYLYRSIPFASRKQFYSPKYTPGQRVIIPDTRATIFWEPYVITDENGKARLKFFTSDSKGSYTINIQGADLSGGIGSATGKVTVR